MNGRADPHGPDRGFTLVELLIVIVILGVLAAVTVFAVRGMSGNAKSSTCEMEKSTLGTAVETYFARYGGTTIPVTGGTLPTGVTWTLGATPGETLFDAGVLHSTSKLYTVSPDGKTLSVTTAGTGQGCS